MADHENITITPAPSEEADGPNHWGPSPSQLDAAVEAAYILDAIRR